MRSPASLWFEGLFLFQVSLRSPAWFARQRRRRSLVSEDICGQRVFDAGTFDASPRRRSFGQRVLLVQWRAVRAGVSFGQVVRVGPVRPNPACRRFGLRYASAKRLTLTLARLSHW